MSEEHAAGKTIKLYDELKKMRAENAALTARCEYLTKETKRLASIALRTKHAECATDGCGKTLDTHECPHIVKAVKDDLSTAQSRLREAEEALRGWDFDAVKTQADKLFACFGDSNDPDIRCAIANLSNANRKLKEAGKALSPEQGEKDVEDKKP